jgi:hypothetical protein
VLATLLIHRGVGDFRREIRWIKTSFEAKNWYAGGDTRQTKHSIGSRRPLPTPEMNNAINLKQAINKWLVACFVAE